MLLRAGVVGEWCECLADGVPKIWRVRVIRLALLGLMAGLASVAAQAAPQEGAQSESPFSVQAGVGYETSTSPFLNISDDGQFLTVNGSQRVSGAYAREAFSGMGNWQAGNVFVAWAANVDNKHSPSSPELDFLSAIGNLTLGIPVSATATVGANASMQKLWVAGDHFRDVRSLNLNWSLGQPDGGFWTADVGVTRKRHPGIYVDMDSQVLSFSLHRHQPVHQMGLDHLDIDFSVEREKNAHGYADLSQRRAYVKVGGESKMGRATFSAGVLVAVAQYDESALPGMPARRDRLLSYDAGVEWALKPGQTMALDVAYAVNKANSAVFDNSYRNVMLTWGLVW